MRVAIVGQGATLEDAMKVRFEVFVDEQGVSPEGERDALDDDPRTIHVVAFDGDGMAFGAGRLLAPLTDTVHGEGTGHGVMDPSTAHIGRLAVSRAARGTGAGRALMQALESAALEHYGVDGGVRVELSAQDHAIPFYERLGYTVYGDPYLDEGIWHRDAFKDVGRLEPHQPSESTNANAAEEI
ncbi:GNAT family N-acetyltransferase [Demequina flava]|uniref:GNAT family N-acetyltransferase n=1 Tax=Demequina flava TaxID=1095025 RepID=UPI0007856EEE|nr:GNAT family N-acetyltransferase [Demequina flava]